MIAINHQSIGTGTGTRVLRSRWAAVTTFCTLGFVLLAVTAGCGPSERQRVQTVSDQFLEAMSQKDWIRAKPLLTEKARDAMGNVNPFTDETVSEDENEKRASSPRSDTYTVGEPSIDDTLASVPVTLIRGERTTLGVLRLRREDGEWRVRALRIEGEGEGDRPGITLDFEEPGAALLGAAFRAVGEGVGEMLKGIGQGMGAFMEGIGKGAAALEKTEKTEHRESPEVTESPSPSPGS